MARIWRVSKDLFWLAVAVAIVAGGVYGFQLLGANATQAAPEEVDRRAPFVETAALERFGGPLPIRGRGFLEARSELDLASEVQGRIVELHPAIDRLGRFAAGETLVRLDDRSARAALARADADLAATQARAELNATQLERVRALVSRGVSNQDRLDVLEAERVELSAQLTSLEAARESAAIALAQTVLSAPFDGAVRSQSAEIGAVVSPGQSIARVFSAGALEVEVPLTEALAALIPGLFEAGDGADAEIRGRFAGRDLVWSGRVARVSPAVDRASRTLTVTVAADGAPRFDLAGDAAPPASGAPQALVGAFVSVAIDGARFGDVFAAPAEAVRRDADGSGAVWLASADGRLEIRPVGIAHVDGATAYVRFDGSVDGRRLIVSPLDAPVDGMRIRDDVSTGGDGVVALDGALR